MGILYSIRNWTERFEVAQARKVAKWSWVALPNKHDGLGFRRIMALPDGMIVYAAWCLMLQVASKCPTRGVLADENGPLDAADLSIKTGAPKAAFERALSALADRKIGWVLVEHYDDAESLPTYRTVQNSTEPNPTIGAAEPPIEGKLDEVKLSPPAPPDPPDPPAPAKKDPPAEDVPMPEALKTPEFVSARDAWFEQRRRRRLSLREKYLVGTYARLLPLGHQAAAACLRFTVDNDYDGVFPDRFVGTKARIGAGQTFDPKAAEKDPDHGTF